jgi:hypothetical protein
MPGEGGVNEPVLRAHRRNRRRREQLLVTLYATPDHCIIGWTLFINPIEEKYRWDAMLQHRRQVIGDRLTWCRLIGALWLNR